MFLGLHKQQKFNLESVKLDVLKIIGYCDNIIINCLKSFLDNKQRIQEEMVTLLKTETFFFLVLPYFGPLSLKARTKLGKSHKGIVN